MALMIINNQPNGNIIGHSDTPSHDPENTPFNELSFKQQCDQIDDMLVCGVAFNDLQTELYLVADFFTDEVWAAFGVTMMTEYEYE